MNLVVLMGRLVEDPTVKDVGNDKKLAYWKIAIDREGSRETDFVPCQAWNKTAEFIGKYFKKGMKILATGRVEAGSFTDKDGNRQYRTAINVYRTEFVESKAAFQAYQESQEQKTSEHMDSQPEVHSDPVAQPKESAAAITTESIDKLADDFMAIPDGEMNEMPFI